VFLRGKGGGRPLFAGDLGGKPKTAPSPHGEKRGGRLTFSPHHKEECVQEDFQIKIRIRRKKGTFINFFNGRRSAIAFLLGDDGSSLECHHSALLREIHIIQS